MWEALLSFYVSFVHRLQMPPARKETPHGYLNR